MSCGKTDYRAQPAVRSIFVYRNGDAHSEARRILVHDRRVCDFETLLREVTGRVRAPFGAVRCIYTPRAGHRVDALEHVRHGEKYVAAGKEKFKKLDYLQIENRKKQTIQNNGQMKAAAQNRMVVSARFLKPIKEPCAIFVVANGDLLNPAVRVLVHSRLLNQYERILEMITEKMGLRIMGGVRSLYLLDGSPVRDAKDLENGQFYIAVGRERFKRLPYTDSLFSKAVGMRRGVRSKAASLPPIDKYSRQNGEATGKMNSSDETKSCEFPASLVRQISQARLMALRKKRSNLSNSNSTQDNKPRQAGEETEQKEKPVEEEQVYSDKDKETKEEEEAAAGEEEVVGEEEAAAVEAAEKEAVVGEEEAAGELEAAEEEAAVVEEEAAAGEEELAAGEEEAEAAEEERVAEKEKAAAAEEEAAAGREEAEAGREEAEAGQEEAEAREEEVEAADEVTAGEEEAEAADEATAGEEEAEAADEVTDGEEEAEAADEATPGEEEAEAADEATPVEELAAATEDETAAGEEEAVAAEEEAAAEKLEAAVEEGAEE